MAPRRRRRTGVLFWKGLGDPSWGGILFLVKGIRRGEEFWGFNFYVSQPTYPYPYQPRTNTPSLSDTVQEPFHEWLHTLLKHRHCPPDSPSVGSTVRSIPRDVWFRGVKPSRGNIPTFFPEPHQKFEGSCCRSHLSFPNPRPGILESDFTHQHASFCSEALSKV